MAPSFTCERGRGSKDHMTPGDPEYSNDVLVLKSIFRTLPAALLPKTAAPNAEDTLSFTMVMVEMSLPLRASNNPI